MWCLQLSGKPLVLVHRMQRISEFFFREEHVSSKVKQKMTKAD